MRAIALVNQKGGCGKTTAAINLAAICAGRGLRTLVVDMDPQSHCAAGLGVPEESLDHQVGDALLSDLSDGFDRSSSIWEVSRHLDLLPSSMALAGLEAPGGGLHQLQDKDRRLALLLRHVAGDYDRCFIDCPPNIGLLTYNALRAAGEAIIPVETGFFALHGAKKQWDTIRHLVGRVNHPIACYILPTLYNPEAKIARDILASIRKQFGGRVIPVVIHERPEIREAATFGQSVSEYAPDSEAVRHFTELADWLDQHPADPPELQIEVARTRTVPYFRADGDGQTLSLAISERQTTDDPSRSSSSSNPGPGSGSRAAEMARKVREMTRQRKSEESPAHPPHDVEGDKVTTAAGSVPATDVAAASGAQCQSDDTHDQSPTLEIEPIDLDDPAFMLRQRRATVIECKDLPPKIDVPPASIVRLFGVRQISQGVMFIQPGVPGMRIHVAGTFNSWSRTACPMRYNRDAGVFELILPLAPGRYEYRLLIDGEWHSDPYNPNRRRNQFGEDNNVLEVSW